MAVRCSRINAIVNGVDARIESRLSNLFENIGPDEKFDMIVFNPPFFFSDPKNLRQRAFMGGKTGEVIRGFWAGVMRHLTPAGRVQVTVSDVVSPSMFEFTEFIETGLKPSLVAKRSSFMGNSVSVYALRSQAT
ncbi:methyltransferase [bacterium]|nr:methyltransferase [bacterium]